MDALSPTLLVGDCRKILPTLPAESVHCCVTSPPYWGLRDYGVEGQIGLERTPEEHVEALVEVFREVWRVLRPEGTCWVNYGDCYAGGGSGTQGKTGQRAGRTFTVEGLGKRVPNGLKPKDLVGMPWRVAFALQADGWWLRSDIIWSKANPMPESVTDRPTRAHEYLFLLTKSPRYFYDQDAIRERTGTEMSWEQYATKTASGKTWSSGGITRNAGDLKPDGGQSHPAGRNKRTVWEIPTQPTPEAHFATFPEALVTPCLLAGTSEWGCCSECGAPWERVVEKGESDYARLGKQNGKAFWRPDSQPGNMGNTRTVLGSVPSLRGADRVTKAWRPACGCEGQETTPCVVLDPFAGSGTVGKVATKLGRRSILIELSEEYAQISNKRNAQLGLML